MIYEQLTTMIFFLIFPDVLGDKLMHETFMYIPNNDYQNEPYTRVGPDTGYLADF